MSKTALAILVSDIHLSDKPPIFRSSEPDWFEAMKRPLDQLQYFANKFDCPIVCGGDVFDKWNSSPELINFAIDNLPMMYSVAGQHDLPHHRYSAIERSAYWTLCKTGNIINLNENEPIEIKNGLMLHGFGWNVDLAPMLSGDLCFHLAVVHRYIWAGAATSYSDAPETNHVNHLSKKLKGFQAALFGDNHKGFLTTTKDGLTIFNHGGFMRRTRDQINYKPKVGVLFSDGTIERKELDCSEDKTLVVENETSTRTEIDFENFVVELEKLGSDSLDFRKSILSYCENQNIEKEVHSLIMELMS
jgi:DNA repair exonuclease SbcCD nuclease subunit